MSLWEELARSAAKGAGRRSVMQQQSKAPQRDARLTYDKRALRQAADEINAFDDSPVGAVLSNISSFFRPAGVAGRRILGEENVRNIAKSWKQQSDEGRRFEADKEMRRALSGTQGIEGNMPSDNTLRDLPNLNFFEGVGELAGSAGRAYRNAVYGPPAQDVLTDKAKRRLAEIKAGEAAQAQRIAQLDKGYDQNFIERMAERFIAPIAPDTAEMFQRRQKDLTDIAMEEGWTTSGAIAGSLLNPLELLGAESKVERAAKLKNAGKARKAINEAGKFLDPIQVGLDTAGDVAKPLREEVAARAWEARRANQAKPAAQSTGKVQQGLERVLEMDPGAAARSVDSIAPVADDGVKPLWQALVDDYEAALRPKQQGLDWRLPGSKRLEVDGALYAPPSPNAKDSGAFQVPRRSLYMDDRQYDPEIMAWVKSLEEAKSGDEIADWYRKLVEGDKQQSVADWYRDIVKSENEVSDWYRNLVKSEDAATDPRIRSLAGDTSQPFEQWFDDAMTDSTELRKLASDTSKSFEQWFDETVNVNDVSAQKRAIIEELMGSQDIAAPRIEAAADNAALEASLGTEASPSAGGIAPRLNGRTAEPLEIQGGRPIDVGAEAMPEPGVAAVDVVDDIAAPRMDEGVVPQSAVPDRIAAAPVEQIDEAIEPAASSFAMERPASKPITQRVEGSASAAREVLGNDELRAALREESGVSGELSALNKAFEEVSPAVDNAMVQGMQRRLEALRAKPSKKPVEYQEMARLQDQLRAMDALPEPGMLGKGRVPRTPNADTGDGFVTLSASFGLPTHTQLVKFASEVKAFIDATKAMTKRVFDKFKDADWIRGGKGAIHDVYITMRRWLNEAPGVVDGDTYAEMAKMQERSDVMTRTIGDVFGAVQQGDLRSIIGRDGPRYKLTGDDKVKVRQFMIGRMSEAEALKTLPADVVDAAKVVRRWMDDKSTELMAEQYRLQHAFVAASSDEQLEVIRSLTESAAIPARRGRLESAVRDAASRGEVNYDIAWYEKAKAHVDRGFRELESEGLWLSGDEAPRDMLLHWAPFIANRGKYDPRLYHFFVDGVPSKDIEGYIAHLEKASGQKFPEDLVNEVVVKYQNPGGSRPSMRDMDRIRKRKDLPEEFKRLLMEVNDPSYTFSVGIAQVNNLKEKLKMRRWAANQSAYVSQPGEDVTAFLNRTGYARSDISQIVAPPGREKMYGAMNGRFVHRDFHDSIHMMHTIDNGLPKDHVHSIHARIVSAFKTAKTVLAPASQMRQLFQNTWAVFANGGFKGVHNIIKGFDDYANSSALYVEARSKGIFAGRRIDEFAEFIDDNSWRELRYNWLENKAAQSVEVVRNTGFMDFVADFADWTLSKVHSVRWNTPRKAARLWQATDDIARMALYKTYREAGDLPEVAASKVKDAVYSGLRKTRFERAVSMSSVSALSAEPTALHKLADYLGMFVGIPFFGAVRYTATQATKDFFGMKAGTWSPMSDPARFARWWGMVGAATAFHGYSKWVDGLSTEEEVRQRPDYMRDLMPTGVIRVPSRIAQLVDGEGKAMYIDTRWLFPIGSFASGAYDVRQGRMRRGNAGSPEAMRPSLPGLDLDLSFSPFLQILAETVANSDGFTGSKIYSEFDPTPTKLRKATAHAWRAWLPPIVPNPFGGAYDALTLPTMRDSELALKERLQAFFQGLANDSGHSASKLAAGIWNSFDYWFDAHGKSLMKASEVTDYRGRPQYIGTALLNAIGIRIDSKDVKASEAIRMSSKKRAIADMEAYYKKRIMTTKNLVTRRELQKELVEAKRRIAQGHPDARWWDDLSDPGIVYENIFNMIRRAKNIRFATPAMTGPTT